MDSSRLPRHQQEQIGFCLAEEKEQPVTRLYLVALAAERLIHRFCAA